MQIKKIHLSDFRNFKSKTVQFDFGVTVIVGPNASGKTNLLESLYLCSTGKSFKARVEEEMVNYGAEIARVSALVDSGNTQRTENELQAMDNGQRTTKLEVVLTRGEITIGNSPKRTEKTPRKRLMVNGVSKRLIDFAGNFKVVLFGPQDLGLVTESPSTRRGFLDFVISQVDREYRRASLSYEKGLRQRNRLLLGVREDGLSRSQLLFWDKLLIKNGDYLSKAREEFIDFVNLAKPFEDHEFSLEYDKSAISEARLDQYKAEEVAAATTLVGPHRDDFVFKEVNTKARFYKARELAKYGSRGEQRMGVLWLKIAELAFIEQKADEKPTLLLDDIFSELDDEHRKIVMQVAKNQQTIITTADEHHMSGFKKVEKIRL